jgi:parallel beta-helix repeat protein
MNGIELSNSDENNITNNIVLENDYGINYYRSFDNRIYHNNFIENTVSANDNGRTFHPFPGHIGHQDTSDNIWNTGYPTGGNYWSDYTGSDENCTEGQDYPGSDGIGDTYYNIPYGRDDLYPLMLPLELRIDTTPPIVSSHNIDNQTTDVPLDEEIIIEFDESMDTVSVESELDIIPAINYSCKWRNQNSTLHIIFGDPLANGITYEVSIGPEARNEAGLNLEEGLDIEFTTVDEPTGPAEFPFLLVLLIVLILMTLMIIYLIGSRRRRKPAPNFYSASIDVTKVKQVTCPHCNNINQVTDNHTIVNFQCSFCHNNLTVHLDRELPHFQSAKNTISVIRISCPECSYAFTVQKSESPMQVQCPDCGIKGMMR